MDNGESSLIETEHKYDVDTDFAFPDLAGLAPGVVAAPPEVQRLAATYFDTNDLRLAGAHITLRRRTGGSDAGWHVKLPVSSDTRRELHFPLGPATGTVPSRVATLVAEWTQGEAPRPIARLETRRAIGRSASPWVHSATRVATRDGTVPVAGPSGKCSSRRVSLLTGSLTCQPASEPPVRRRSVMWAPARRRSL